MCSIYDTHTHTHTQTHTFTHTGTKTLIVTCTQTHTHTHIPTEPASLTHTHNHSTTPTETHSHSHTHYLPPFSYPLSLLPPQIGSFFMINLCLVVIATQFSETKQREHQLMQEQRAQCLSSSTLASMA